MAAGSYIVLIKFVGDTSSLSKMEKDMNGRFNKVTKRFGQGLAKAGKMIKFSAFAAGAVSILTSVLNPLQEINSALDNILAKAGNIKDQAYNMDTSVGMYAAMQSAAAAKGIDQAQFNMMGQRIMELIGAAKNGEDNVLSKYKNEKDMGLVLYKVVEALKNMGPGAQRAAMASQIFGGRISGRMAGLLDTGFDEPLTQVMQGVNLKELENAVTSLDEKSNLQSALRANLDLRDIVAKNGIVSNHTIAMQNRTEEYKLKKENKLLSDYKTPADMQMALYDLQIRYYEKIMPLATFLVNNFNEGLDLIDTVSEIQENINSLANVFSKENPILILLKIYSILKNYSDRGR